MRRLKAQKTSYEIKEPLGSGLTSDVYKAFRVDDRGWTSQEVALKIIKSKNDVQILKKEFENLLKVESKYCVRIHAWENLQSGPALVLEYIDGVTLHELLDADLLTVELCREILAQISLGLSSLHRHQVFHGDLNLKNIMINTDGVVKLIDFGFGDAKSGQLLTPCFASPTRLAGAPPCSVTDRESLRSIQKHMLARFTNEQAVDKVSALHTKARHRRSLALKVTALKIRKSKKTTRLPIQSPALSRSVSVKPLLLLLSFLLTLVLPLLFQEPVQRFPLEIRSQRWFLVSLNGLPMQYGPVEIKNLRYGDYNIRWQGAEGSGTLNLRHRSEKTFLLQPEINKL